jgi:S-adenosylmethionine hydrolase
VVYVDHFGNLATGLRAATLPEGTILRLGNHRLRRATTYSEVPRGAAFWYENSNTLAEIAVNCGRAADVLGAGVGTQVLIEREN